MTIEQIRAQIASGIWQGIAQSGVDLSTVPQEGQEKLVTAITNRVMMTMNQVLQESLQDDASDVTGKSTPAQSHEDEKTGDEYAEKNLWKARPFLSLNEEYILTNERIKIIHGLVSRRIENFELVRVQDIDFKQNVGERMLGIGDITIRGHDQSDPIVILRNVHNPEGVYEIIRRAWMDARKRHGLQFREYM